MKTRSANLIICIVITFLTGLFAFTMTAGAAETRISADDGAEDNRFGASAAISGNYAIVGADGDDDNGTASGSAYIFYRSGTLWTQQAKLTASDGAAEKRFGCAVAISGDYAIVGAYGDNTGGNNSGAAYIFYRSGTLWVQQAKLTASDGATEKRFGFAVSVSDDYAIAGAYGDDAKGDNSGAVYIFYRSGATWTQQAKLTASNALANDRFGYAAAISGDYAVVGADGDDDNGNDSGSAYIFYRSGTSWTQQAKLTAGDAAADDNFGHSVAISGAYAVIGAVYDDDNETDAGSAYIFHHYGHTWQQQAKLTANDAASDGHFGVSVAISDDNVLVGADGDDDNGSASGAAYIFYRSGTAWAQQAKLMASDGATDDMFGNSVAISDGYAIAGVFGDDHNGSNSGAAYIYDRFDSVLIADFGGAGLSGYANNAWLLLNGNDPSEITAMDINGDDDDELIAAFADFGLYVWNGWTWTQISTEIPGGMIAWDHKLAVDFDSRGIWTYNTTDGWVNLSVNDPDIMAVANVNGAGNDELIVYFSGLGLYTWDGSTWTNININTPDILIGWNNRLVADFGSSLGVWTYSSTEGWVFVNMNDPSMMVAGADSVAFWFPILGLYKWSGTGWDNINPNRPDAIVWQDSKLVGDFGAGLGIWSYDTDWFQMNSNDPDSMAVTDINGDAQKEVTAAFSNGVWYNVNGSDWTQINTNQAEKLVAIKSNNINQNNYKTADVNGDGKIMMEDVIYILQKVAFIR
ncbi:FG-GAP repeat protein [Desulfococcaceae bacterium HSG9]|nr:FG-GAP repeat protein [Desulfococcaceae bacterium HSG9]